MLSVFRGAAVALFAISSGSAVAAPKPDSDAATAFERDRAAILAMAGDFKVKFDFEETVSLSAGYALKDRKISGGYEVVRVIEDRGDFISLQHILVVGQGDEKFPIKHWRQDWRYEPKSVLVFIGGNAWEPRKVASAERKGSWSQTVYQTDDSPRYGAVASWTHENKVSAWTPPAEWRPLPRRDMTTRDDYQAIDAVNRHAITPFGWVHEQDNTKLVLAGTAHALVREIGVNTYEKSDSFEVAIADDYWAATQDFWAAVRGEWSRLESAGGPFGLTVQGESEELYGPLLETADALRKKEIDLDGAIARARALIAEFVTTSPAPLAERIAATPRIEKTAETAKQASR